MRPSVDTDGCKVYECPQCSARYDDPESRYCEDCEVTLRCLANSRDL